MKRSSQISLSAYRSGDGFIGHYQNLIYQEAVPYQYEVLNDRAEGAEKSHAILNFVNAGRVLHGQDAGDGFYGMVFQDSDVAKWLEAVADILVNFPDPDLNKKADDVIAIIEAAQDTDGYLNTYYTVKDQEKRWTNLTEGHELYCAGHMMEAAVAYYEATGKDRLLKVMEKNAEHIYRHFVLEGHPGVPGHPEVELALLKLYRATGNRHALELAKHFIDERGKDPDFFRKESRDRSWTVWGNDGSDPDYMQAGKPVREQTRATGHAVRAVYLYTAMADLASETGDEELLSACRRLLDNMQNAQMYITGGIGSTVLGEAFSTEYDLPNDTAYCETCASIGLIFFLSRLLEMETDSSYADLMERAFYNTVLAGMQLDGKRFFYVNPLECQPGISGVAGTHRHTLTMRPKWYACACCPPNTARLIASFGKYAYGENETTAFCHLYAEGRVQFKNGLSIECETKYPYGFTVTYRVLSGSGTLAVRLPGYSEHTVLKVNGAEKEITAEKGYVYLSVKAQDVLEYSFDDNPYYVYASGKVPALSGRAALMRGPLVYCFEGKDRPDGDVFSLRVRTEEQPVVEEKPDEELCGAVCLTVPAVKSVMADGLYTKKKPESVPVSARAIPYFTWCNRGENEMRVWMPAD